MTRRLSWLLLAWLGIALSVPAALRASATGSSLRAHVEGIAAPAQLVTATGTPRLAGSDFVRWAWSAGVFASDLAVSPQAPVRLEGPLAPVSEHASAWREVREGTEREGRQEASIADATTGLIAHTARLATVRRLQSVVARTRDARSEAVARYERLQRLLI